MKNKQIKNKKNANTADFMPDLAKKNRSFPSHTRTFSLLFHFLSFSNKISQIAKPRKKRNKRQRDMNLLKQKKKITLTQKNSP